MTSAPGLPARLWPLAQEAARFCVVGLTGLAVTDLGANLLHYEIGLNGLLSFAIATVVGTAITYVASRYWTFRHRDRTSVTRESVVFFAINGVGVAISEGCIAVTYPLHDNSKLAYNIAMLGGVGLASLFRFWSYRNWVWRTRACPAGAVDRPAATGWRGLRRACLPRPGYERLAHELPRFSLVGVCALTVTGIGTDLLHFQAGAGPLESNVAATFAAAGISFLGNRRWTFRHREQANMGREGLVFLVLNGAGLAIQLAALGFTTYVLGQHGRLAYNTALVSGIALATLFRFCSYRTWVWPAPPVSRAPERSLIQAALG